MIAAHGGDAAPQSAAFETYGRRDGSLAGALDALKADRYADAIQRRNGLSDPLDRRIVDTFLIRSGSPRVTSAMIADFAARPGAWPDGKRVRAYAEAALSRENPAPDVVIAAMGGRAVTPVGKRLLAKALIARGDTNAGLRLVRDVWHRDVLGTSLQSGFVADFAKHLTIEDHLTRIDRLVGQRAFAEAQALRSRLGAGPRAYLAARLAAATGASNALAKLDGVPAALQKRPGHHLARARALRQAGEVAAAARVLENAPKAGRVDGDAWWVETRIVARMLAEADAGRRAYRLLNKRTAESPAERADQAFHAGWFALRHLSNGRRAETHFAALAKIATTPISSARAAYWRGRAAQARRDERAAKGFFRAAAAHGFTYYGQLARAELGLSGTGVGRAPQPTAADKLAFRRNPVAEATRRLIATGHSHRIVPFLDHLADALPTPGQVVLAASLAEDAGAPHLALRTAKRAQRRGLDVGRLAHPTAGIPKAARMPDGLERALVYAIARQESAFNPTAVSPAGARGLMQVMPRTGRAMARELGLRHSTAKLTSDPAHNAALGAAYLHKRLGEFDGSYILTFAAYNAGARRVAAWIERFGDPRDPKVDPVAWVEDIPYPETRNYVQRVMENVQVYREALGRGRLAITADLSRGRAS